MGKIAPVALFLDVGHAEDIQLLLAGAAGAVNRQQDRKGEARADEADHRDELEKAQHKIGVHGMMLQNIFIGDLVHIPQPIEHPGRGRGGALLGSQNPEVGSGHVHAALTAAQDDKEQDHDQGDCQGRDDSGDEAEAGVRGIFGILILASRQLRMISTCHWGAMATHRTADHLMKAGEANITEIHDDRGPYDPWCVKIELQCLLGWTATVVTTSESHTGSDRK